MRRGSLINNSAVARAGEAARGRAPTRVARWRQPPPATRLGRHEVRPQCGALEAFVSISPFISNHDSVQPSGRGFGGVHRRSADNRLKVTALVVHGSVRPVRLADRLPLPGPEPPVVDRGGDRRLGDERQVRPHSPIAGSAISGSSRRAPARRWRRRLVRPDVRQRNRHAEHAEELAREGDSCRRPRRAAPPLHPRSPGRRRRRRPRTRT